MPCEKRAVTVTGGRETCLDSLGVRSSCGMRSGKWEVDVEIDNSGLESWTPVNSISKLRQGEGGGTSNGWEQP